MPQSPDVVNIDRLVANANASNNGSAVCAVSQWVPVLGTATSRPVAAHGGGKRKPPKNASSASAGSRSPYTAA